MNQEGQWSGTEDCSFSTDPPGPCSIQILAIYNKKNFDCQTQVVMTQEGQWSGTEDCTFPTDPPGLYRVFYAKYHKIEKTG